VCTGGVTVYYTFAAACSFPDPVTQILGSGKEGRCVYMYMYVRVLELLEGSMLYLISLHLDAALLH